ncbi:MAG: STAS domain-containing protein [Microbispora sp.]|nr:STAS domain-containing protein [Microbispora sp.]
MSRLCVTVRRDPSHTVLTLGGELDVATAEQMTNAFTAEYEAGRRRVILDVAGLTFCDSYCLGLLLQMQDQCARGGGCLVLVGVGGMLAQVIRMTGLERAFAQADTVERATAEY